MAQPTLYFMHELVMEPDPPVIRFVPVERCEHGYIDRHSYVGGYGRMYCPGSPTLAEVESDTEEES